MELVGGDGGFVVTGLPAVLSVMRVFGVRDDHHAWVVVVRFFGDFEDAEDLHDGGGLWDPFLLDGSISHLREINFVVVYFHGKFLLPGPVRLPEGSS